MPAQKRSSNLQQGNEDDVSQNHSHRHRRKHSRRGGVADQAATTSRRPAVLQSPQQQENPNEQQQSQDHPFLGDRESENTNPPEDSDGSGTDPEDFDEVITVLRSELRNNVQCPICLGIIKKTRTVMGCLHRFCQECIDKSMRLGNNECPACRIHCASRRSLRDDQVYDRLIDAIYPDAEKYEEEELLFHEEDKTRNEQIQASIAQVSRRQLEASNRRRKLGKDADDIYPLRAPRSCRNLYSRRRSQRTEAEIEENETENEHDGNESPNQKDGKETKQRRFKRRTGTSPSTSPSTSKPDGGNYGNSVMETKEVTSIPHPVPVYNPEKLTWGRGGARSHTRNGGASSSRLRGSRISKLVDHLESVSKSEAESDVHLLLVSLENLRIPSLAKPFVSCRSSLSINQLREHVAQEIRSPAGDIEMLLVKNAGASHKTNVNSLAQRNIPTKSSPGVNLSNARLQVLEGKGTLAEVSCCSHKEPLVLGYRLKKDNSPVHLSPA